MVTIRKSFRVVRTIEYTGSESRIREILEKSFATSDPKNVGSCVIQEVTREETVIVEEVS